MLDGRGSTAVWNDAGKRITFEWKAGAMFAIPLNCWHQHFNGSGQEPARYVAVTNGPSVMNLYDDVEFRLQHRLRLQEPLRRRARLLHAQDREEGLPAGHQFRARRGQPAADHREGARRRRRPYPLQHGQGLDVEPHLAVPRRHLQEGARARPDGARHHSLRRRLFADVAGGRGAASATTGRSAR